MRLGRCGLSSMLERQAVVCPLRVCVPCACALQATAVASQLMRLQLPSRCCTARRLPAGKGRKFLWSGYLAAGPWPTAACSGCGCKPMTLASGKRCACGASGVWWGSRLRAPGNARRPGNCAIPRSKQWHQYVWRVQNAQAGGGAEKGLHMTSPWTSQDRSSSTQEEALATLALAHVCASRLPTGPACVCMHHQTSFQDGTALTSPCPCPARCARADNTRQLPARCQRQAHSTSRGPPSCAGQTAQGVPAG